MSARSYNMAVVARVAIWLLASGLNSFISYRFVLEGHPVFGALFLVIAALGLLVAVTLS